MPACDSTGALARNAPFTASGQIRIYQDGVDTYIQLNVNTDTNPDAMIRIVGTHDVSASWFVL